MINKLQDFIDKDEKNKFYVVGALVFIFSVLAYFAFFNKTSKSKYDKNKSAEIQVSTKDTVFKENRSGYFKKVVENEDKKIVNDDEFYKLRSNVNNLKNEFKEDSVVIKENSNTDIDLIKKAIREQQELANRGGRRKVSNRTYKRAKTNNTTTYERKKNEDWREQYKEQTDDFFNSHSSDFKEKTVKQNLRTDPEIYAVVFGTQEVKNNTRVKMRLSKNAFIDGVLHKRNTIVHGFVSFAEHRVFVNIKHINDIPVNLSVYDAQDYDRGLFTKQNFSKAVSDEIKDEAIDEVPVKVPFVNTVKTLFKRKGKTDKAIFDNNTMLTFKNSN